MIFVSNESEEHLSHRKKGKISLERPSPIKGLHVVCSSINMVKELVLLKLFSSA